MTNSNRYIQAGYTHMIHFSEMHPEFGKIKKSFPTTADAVESSIKNLRKKGFFDAYCVAM